MNRILSRAIRKSLRRVAEAAGINQLLQRGFVAACSTGERMKFMVDGRPRPETTLLLAGSGRSGTTWLSEVLSSLPGVQPIFEPLHPAHNSEAARLTSWTTHPWWDQEGQRLSQWNRKNPYFKAAYLRPDGDYPEWRDLWHSILTGSQRNYWTDMERRTLFPDRFLVKEIHANLMLGFLYRSFRLPIVYIMRHPCAVVSSRLAGNWHVDPKDIIQQEQLVEDHLHPWIGAMEQETDRVGAHAVWWAVENHVALHQLSSIPHHLVIYEEMVLNPAKALVDLLEWLGYRGVPSKIKKRLSKPSRMSSTDMLIENQRMSLTRWERRLSQADQVRVLSWAHRLGLDRYQQGLHPPDSHPSCSIQPIR